MTASGPTGPAPANAGEPAIVHGVDVDALAAAVRSCPGVDDLDGGRLGGLATYLPGRQVPGIRIEADRVGIAVRGTWNTPLEAIAGQIRAAAAPLLAGQVLDIELSDVADPPGATPSGSEPPAGERALAAATPALGAPDFPPSPAGGAEREDDQQSWPTPHTTPPGAPPAGSSSAPITPTSAETPPSS